MFIIFAWYCAFRLNTVIEAAEGEPDLPRMTLTDGFVDDGLFPLLRWIGSWAIVLLPAITHLSFGVSSLTAGQVVVAGSGGIGALIATVGDVAPAFLTLLGVGLFLWPMVVLCISIGGFSTLGRPNLILATIFRTFPAYILTVALVFGTVALSWFVATATQGAGTTGKPGDAVVKAVFLVGLVLYLDIVAMRSIGLYYHHFKNRFAWDWG